MIKFDVITIFPEMFSSYLKESLISRAQQKKIISRPQGRDIEREREREGDRERGR